MFELVQIGDDHIYKRGTYDLKEETNRETKLAKRNDFSWNIYGFVTNEMVYILSKAPFMREKSDFSLLYHEIYTRIFQGKYYLNS